MAFAIRPLTPNLWPAFEDLFGKKGACNGCWCMYWRLGPAYGKRPREANRGDFHAIVERGPPPGLLAFDGETAVGWCQLTARDDLPWLDQARGLERVDDAPVWSISCFYVRASHRRRGVTAALIEAAAAAARQAGAPALEAYPVDGRHRKANPGQFTGIASTFESAGFRTVARRTPARPVMRRELEPPNKS